MITKTRGLEETLIVINSDTVKGLLRSGMMKGPLKAGSMMECQALWIERMI